jgi:hypothetical protein
MAWQSAHRLRFVTDEPLPALLMTLPARFQGLLSLFSPPVPQEKRLRVVPHMFNLVTRSTDVQSRRVSKGNLPG